jgi:hypothetical protein
MMMMMVMMMMVVVMMMMMMTMMVLMTMPAAGARVRDPAAGGGGWRQADADPKPLGTHRVAGQVREGGEPGLRGPGIALALSGHMERGRENARWSVAVIMQLALLDGRGFFLERSVTITARCEQVERRFVGVDEAGQGAAGLEEQGRRRLLDVLRGLQQKLRGRLRMVRRRSIW